MTSAELEISRLGAEVDPHLDYLLTRLGRSIEAQQGGDASPVETLYRAWDESGMAREGYPGWLTLWGPDGLPRDGIFGSGFPDRVPLRPPVCSVRTVAIR